MAAATPSPTLKLTLKTRFQLGILSVVTDIAQRSDHTVNRRLMNLCDRKIPPNATPIKGVSTHDVTIDPAHDLWIRLFIPTSTTTEKPNFLPVVVFFHGGGFVFLSPGSYSYDGVCRRFARKLNAVIISVNYRLAPEHKFPAQYDDAFDVLRFIDASPEILREKMPFWPENADVSQCFLMGDSAGGNIAHNTAVRVCESSSLKKCESSSLVTRVKVMGTVAIQPFFGGEERLESEVQLEGAPVVSMARTDWMWKAFLPEDVGPDHWAKNVSGPNAKDVSGLDLPPTLVVVGGFDPLKDWQMRYVEWMKKSGKEVKLLEYPMACHAFYVFPDVAESRTVIGEIKEFMVEQLSKANENGFRALM